jgi:general stress protein 26
MPKKTPGTDDPGTGGTVQDAGDNVAGKDLKKLRKIIKSTRTAMMTTVARDGSLRSRPMATLPGPFDGYLWFLTHAGAPVADEVQENQKVNLGYAENGRFLSVSGTASVSRDAERVKQLWKGWLKNWFPEGKKDPNLAILRVRVDHAEYWDPKASRMVQMPGLLSAVIAGRAAVEPAGANRNDQDAQANPMGGAQG